MKGIRIVKEQYQTGDLTFKGNILPVETPGSVWYMNRKKRKEHFMSQLIACQNAHGIVLATDGKAIDFDPSGKMIELKVDRLVQIGKHVAILTGGAADGVAMCHALKSFLNEEKLDDIQDVYGASLPFLSTEFERFMRKRCEILPVDPIHHVYFVLGGYTAKDPQRPFRLYLLWTKKKLPQLDGDEISFAYTAPRIMGLEYWLNQLCKQDAPLDQILSEVKKGMEKVAKTQEEIGPPFSYAFITREGFRKVD
jgi:20S proteasome alpha/beta subunit